VGPFKIFERNRFYFCFYKQNWVCKKLALSATPCFSDGPTVRTVRMRGSQTQSLCQFQICQRRRRRSGATAAWRVTSIRHTTSRLRSAIAAVCYGCGVRQRCTLAKNHHLAKLSRLRHCQMRKEIDLPSGPWHRQPLRYT
jgi:hypothetical protein